MVRVLVSSASIKVFIVAIRMGSLAAARVSEPCTWGNGKESQACHFKVLKTKFYSHKQL